MSIYDFLMMVILNPNLKSATMTVVLGAYRSTNAIWSHNRGTMKFATVITMDGRNSKIKPRIPSSPDFVCLGKERQRYKCLLVDKKCKYICIIGFSEFTWLKLVAKKIPKKAATMSPEATHHIKMRTAYNIIF